MPAVASGMNRRPAGSEAIQRPMLVRAGRHRVVQHRIRQHERINGTRILVAETLGDSGGRIRPCAACSPIAHGAPLGSNSVLPAAQTNAAWTSSWGTGKCTPPRHKR